MWHILYNVGSSADIGTLFQARNFLNVRNVPENPIRDINASEELLLKYRESLLLAAYKHLRRTSNMDILDSGNDTKNGAIFDNLLSLLLNYYIFPKKHSKYHCPYCEKKYKAVETLCKHIKEKHSCFKEVKSKDASENYLQNYSRNA